MRTRSRSWLVVVLALVLVVAAGCGSQKGGGGSGGKVAKGGVLRMGVSSTIDSLNPFVSFQATSTWVYTNIYPYLVTYDAALNFQPYFAKSWQQSADGRTWTFHTVPNAKWSDGQPLTARDIAWELSTIVKFQDDATAMLANTVTHLDSAEATDDNTVVLHYSKAVANVLSQLVQLAFLPQHIWEPLAKGNAKGLKTYANTPAAGKPLVSGGPFMLTKYQKDQLALMQRNPNWWGPKPNIDGVGVQIFANDDAMLTAFKHGQLDAVSDVPSTAVQSLSGSYNLNRTPGNFFYDFIINSNPKKTSHRELLNPTVREAFEHAIDRQQIVKVALNGEGQPGTTIVPPSTGKWHNPNVKPLPFDLAKANQLLDGLGYKKGADGIRVADGHPMQYQVIVPTSRTAQLTPTFRIIQGAFKQIGVAVSEKILDPNAAFAAITAPDNKYLNFDLSLWDWIPEPDPDYIISVLTCDQYGNNSDTGYCNPKYDALYKQQGVTIDQAKRLQLVYQAQEMIATDRPYIVMSYPNVVDAYSKQWAGFYNAPGYGLFDLVQTTLQVHKAGQ
jgi:peptide/nickel transport system substrate-binding protein